MTTSTPGAPLSLTFTSSSGSTRGIHHPPMDRRKKMVWTGGSHPVDLYSLFQIRNLFTETRQNWRFPMNLGSLWNDVYWIPPTFIFAGHIGGWWWIDQMFYYGNFFSRYVGIAAKSMVVLGWTSQGFWSGPFVTVFCNRPLGAQQWLLSYKTTY